MNRNLSQDSSEQHTSDGGYSSVNTDPTAQVAHNFSEDVEVMRDPVDTLAASSIND